jgi:hypothetical protein
VRFSARQRTPRITDRYAHASLIDLAIRSPLNVAAKIWVHVRLHVRACVRASTQA